jgi:hypothetical protein
MGLLKYSWTDEIWARSITKEAGAFELLFVSAALRINLSTYSVRLKLDETPVAAAYVWWVST